MAAPVATRSNFFLGWVTARNMALVGVVIVLLALILRVGAISETQNEAQGTNRKSTVADARDNAGLERGEGVAAHEAGLLEKISEVVKEGAKVVGEGLKATMPERSELHVGHKVGAEEQQNADEGAF